MSHELHAQVSPTCARIYADISFCVNAIGDVLRRDEVLAAVDVHVYVMAPFLVCHEHGDEFVVLC